MCGRSLAGFVSLNSAVSMDVYVVCCKSRQKAECRMIKRKNQLRLKYRAQENTKKKKKFRLGGDFSDSSRLPPRRTRSHAHGYGVFSSGGKVVEAWG
jgi:hypothetical protein